MDGCELVRKNKIITATKALCYGVCPFVGIFCLCMCIPVCGMCGSVFACVGALVCAGVNACVCRCLWTPKAGVRSLSPLLSTSSIEVGVLR